MFWIWWMWTNRWVTVWMFWVYVPSSEHS
jgi:hypothetical protein